MTSPKIVFLVVHGAWHPPACYNNLKNRLEAQGYGYICPQLPSLGPDSRGVTYQSDVALIRKIALEQFDQGKEVVLIAHSAGGISASAAIDGLEVTQRIEEGKTGGFRHIIYISAFAVPTRRSDLLSTLGGAWPDWQDAGEPYTKNHLITLRPAAKNYFYNDLPEPEAQKYFDILLPHSQDAFETPVDYIPSDITIPKTYIICENDQAIPAALQRDLVSKIPGMHSESLNTGHSPFLSEPHKCVELLVRIVEDGCS